MSGRRTAAAAVPASRSLPNSALAALLTGAALAGGVVGGTVGAYLQDSISAVAEGGQAAPAVATFDAVRFRAEEHAAMAPEPTFDIVRFRAEEHRGFRPQPTFDAVKFRAEEREPLGN